MRRLLTIIIFYLFALASTASASECGNKGQVLFSDYETKHKVLQKGGGKTFASQVTEANTIYEIRDEFDLNNKTITIPENCVLLFAGGTLKNGTLVGNNTYLQGRAESLLNETLVFRNADQFHIDGVTFPKGKNISVLAQRMLDVFNVLELQTGTYYISSPLIIKNHYAKIKGAGKGTILTTDRKLDFAIRTAFNKEVKSSGQYYNVSFVEISDLRIDGTSSKFFKNGVFLDGPSCTVSNCFITRIQSVGVKLSEWCNNLFNCIITHCDIGALITLRANGVNVCYNRIESNNVNVVVHGFRGINISNNTLEGAAHFNIVVGSGQSCNIKDNYFEGAANSITSMLSTTENRSLKFSGSKELKGLLWIGPIIISENNHLAKISYKIGSSNAPSSVDIRGNYIDIHDDNNAAKLTPEVYFALIGSCSAYCTIQSNTFTHKQNAVCGFFDTDNAVLGDVVIKENYVTGSTLKIKSLDSIFDSYSKIGWRSKNHFEGELSIDVIDK